MATVNNAQQMSNRFLNCPECDRGLVAPARFSKTADAVFSIALLPIALILLAYSFFLLNQTPLAFPAIILSGLVFGVSCMGLNRSYAVLTRAR